MKFKGIHIYGFGKWVDYRLDFVRKNENLTVIYGENEAGKSTLQQFVLYILFDLPPRKRKQFEPKTSSHFGGELVIEDEEIGEVTLQRTETRFIVKDELGQLKDLAWYQDFLKQMTDSVYESIYAVTAEQLDVIRDLNRTQLNDVLMNVSMSGSNHLYDVEKELHKKMDELFKPQGRRPELNEQLNQMVELEKELKQAKEGEQSYHHYKVDEQSLLVSIDDLRDKEVFLYEQLKFLQNLQSHLFEIETYKEEKQRLDFLGELSFPHQGMERYENIKAKKLEHDHQIHRLRTELAYVDKKLIDLQEMIYDDDLVERIIELRKRKEEYRDLIENINRIRAQVEQLEEAMEHIERSDQLNRTMIDSQSFTSFVKNRWVSLQKDYDQWLANDEAIKKREFAYDSEVATIDEAIRSLKRERKDKEDYETLKHKVNETTSQEAKEQMTFLAKERQKLAKTILYSGLSIGVILTISYFITQKTSLLIIGMMAALFGLVSYGMTQSTTKQINDLFSGDHVNRDEFRSLKESYVKENDLRKQIEQLKNRLTHLKHEETIIQHEKNNVEKNHDQLKEQIAQEIERFPLLRDIDIIYWDTLFDRLQTLQGHVRKKTELTKELKGLLIKKTEMNNQLTNLGQAINRQELSFDRLEDMVAEQEEYKNKYKDDLEHKEDLQKQLEVILSHLQILVENEEALFEEASVESEDDYYKAFDHYKENEKRRESVDLFEKKLKTLFTTEARNQVLNKEWTLQTVKDKINYYQAELEGVREHLNEQYKELAEIREALQRLEKSEQLSILTYQYEIEKEKIKELARQWVLHKMNYEAIQAAKETYQEKYLKAILLKASDYFKRLTQEVYKAIRFNEQKDRILVEDYRGLDYTVLQLSKGTVDQLYIALRLAIGEVMSKRLNLPYLLDDIFVHFDEHRLKKAVDLICDVAKDKQIIFMTCHRNVYEQFQVDDLEERVVKHHLS